MNIKEEDGQETLFKSLTHVEEYAKKHSLPFKIEADGSLVLYVYDQQGKEKAIRFVESTE